MNQTPVSNFTLGDMANRMVAYENNAVTDVQRDGFRVQAVVEGVTESELADFDISIYPEAYWTPLKVRLAIHFCHISTLCNSVIVFEADYFVSFKCIKF